MSGEIFAGFRVLGFDLETTGFDVRKERIVEYALVGSEIDGSRINLQSFVNPGKRIPIDSTNVHGIKDVDVKNSVLFFRENPFYGFSTYQMKNIFLLSFLSLIARCVVLKKSSKD